MRKQNRLRLMAMGVITVLLLSLCACAGGGTVSSAPAGDGAVDAVEDVSETTTTPATTTAATTTKKIPTTVKHNVNDTKKPSTTSTTAADSLRERLCFCYPDGSPAVEAYVWWTNADGTINEEFEDSWYVANEEGIMPWDREKYGSVEGVKFHVGFAGGEDKYHVSEFTKESTDNEIIYTFILK